MKQKNSSKINSTFRSDDERENLKRRIIRSINFDKGLTEVSRNYNIFFSIGIAASIILCLSLSANYYFNQKSSIDNFIDETSIVNFNELKNVQLILNNDEKIEITDDNSKIVYSKTGEKVTIGEDGIVNQSSKRNKVSYNTLIVPYGKRSQIELSDGSFVWLNSGSKLIYPLNFTGSKREVSIEGEAIFEIAHQKDKPFIVIANNHVIEVLGTVFSISNYLDDDTISTVLKSGSVEIQYGEKSFLKPNKTLKIKPGTLATYKKYNHTISSEKTDVEKHFSWRRGVFIFKQDNLYFIMKKLSRYYNVNICMNEVHDEELKNQTFSGYLDLKEDVESVIKLIKETAAFEYKKSKDNKIIIN